MALLFQLIGCQILAIFSSGEADSLSVDLSLQIRGLFS